MELFLEDLDQSLRNFTYCNNIDLNPIISLINELTDRHFPKKRLSRQQYKTSKNPWITSKILASIKQNNKLYTTYIKTKCPLSLANYKKIRNKVTHDKEVAKKAYFENLFNNTSNSTDTWKLINRPLRKHAPKAEMPQQLKVNKKTITNSLEICNEINKHFVEIGEKFSAKVPMLNNDEQSFRRFLGKRQSSSIVFQSTDEHEIIEIIADLNCSKFTGYIDIPTALFEESKFLISRHLARVFNKCLETGSYPDILKVAKVIPLHKKGSKCDVGNYRPISILSPVNKVFEIILHRRLIDFWNKYNLFTDKQFGFRNQHSTKPCINVSLRIYTKTTR